jgi:hypothetical protein
MPDVPSFASFKDDLFHLVSLFEKKASLHETENYDEAALRNDFLTPFWRALGWDTENREGASQLLREVEIETRVDIAGKKKRADYIFRTNGISRFVCEAKKPREDLSRKFAYQAQRYAFNLGLFPVLLSNFKEMQLFFVGGKPDQNEPFPVYKTWHFTEFKAKADELWALFARESVASGSLDKIVASLRKKPMPGKARQGWLWISKAKSDTQRNIILGTLRTTSRRIDQLAFEMYGLTEEDAKILMEGLKAAEGQRTERAYAKTRAAVATATLF